MANTPNGGQGGNASAPTQAPKTSGTPVKDTSAPGTAQPSGLRGYARSGIGGSGNGSGNKVPQ